MAAPNHIIGLRFVPTEEELITYYLDRRLKGLPYSSKFVVERDLYGDKSPWELFSDQTDPWQTSKVSDKRNRVRIERVIHVITPLKNASQSRINRLSGCGVWHGEGGPFDIRDDNGNVIGQEKTYCFKVTAADSENIPRLGHWIMHEFSITTTGGGAANSNNYVICKLSRDDSKPLKRAPCKKISSREPLKRARARTATCNEQEGHLQTKKLNQEEETATDDDQSSSSSKRLRMATAGFQDQDKSSICNGDHPNGDKVATSTSSSYGLQTELNNSEHYTFTNGASTSTISFSDDYTTPLLTNEDLTDIAALLQVEETDNDNVFGWASTDHEASSSSCYYDDLPNNVVVVVDVAPSPTPLPQSTNSGGDSINIHDNNTAQYINTATSFLPDELRELMRDNDYWKNNPLLSIPQDTVSQNMILAEVEDTFDWGELI